MLYLTKRRTIRRFDEASRGLPELPPKQAIDVSVGWVETALSSKPNMVSPEPTLGFAVLNPTYRIGMAATGAVPDRHHGSFATYPGTTRNS